MTFNLRYLERKRSVTVFDARSDMIIRVQAFVKFSGKHIYCLDNEHHIIGYPRLAQWCVRNPELASREVQVNVFRAMPEPPVPRESSRKIPALLLTVLLSIVLVFVFVVVFLHSANSFSRQMSSSNWSGYSVVSNLNNPQPRFTKVNASWTVPTISVSVDNSFSAEWIGVGGQFDRTLIQTGTEQDSVGGQVTYRAWYELAPDTVLGINSLSISPGDRITASISLVNPQTDTWSIEIHDVTNGQFFLRNFIYVSSALSAEWIVERPTVASSSATLADFGQVTFAGCGATLNGKSGTISSFPSNRITMYDDQNKQLVNVSTLTQDGSSFTVGFLD